MNVEKEEASPWVVGANEARAGLVTRNHWNT